MTLDFVKKPELVGEDLDLYFWQSPHFQIFEDVHGTVVRVHDGDTLTIRIPERDFDFPIRFNNSAAPELSERGGHESRDWLKGVIEGRAIDVIIDPDNRVEKWGRLLGEIRSKGIDMGLISHTRGQSVPWIQRKDMVFPDFKVGWKTGDWEKS